MRLQRHCNRLHAARTRRRHRIAHHPLVPGVYAVKISNHCHAGAKARGHIAELPEYLHVCEFLFF